MYWKGNLDLVLHLLFYPVFNLTDTCNVYIDDAISIHVECVGEMKHKMQRQIQ